MIASGPITSWQINGETMETVIDFILVRLQNHCSHKIKRCLLLGRIAMSNLDSVLKSIDFTLLTKVHLVEAMVLLVAIYTYESWTFRKLSTKELMIFNCGVGKDF